MASGFRGGYHGLPMADTGPLRNIVIIAHIDAGKTTVTERILYYSHREHRMGEVDLGTATMDWMPEEQRHGITITAAATTVFWRKHRIQLVDTPGHVDFTAEVERALRVLDGAVGIFCGTAGVQAQSETVWRQADRYKVPRLAFVNKLDRVGSDFFRVLESIRSRLRANAVPVQIPLGREKRFEGVIDLIERRSLRFDAETLGERVLVGDLGPCEAEECEAWRTKLLEAACEFDDQLLERYLSGQPIASAEIKAALRKGTLERRITPVLCGAALRNMGIQPLLDAVCDYLPAPEDVGFVIGTDASTKKEIQRKLSVEEPLAALAFKTALDAHGDLVYVRVYSGRLVEGGQVRNSRTGECERAQKLYFMHANHREPTSSADTGSIVAVTGFKETCTGDTLCDPKNPIFLEPPRFPDSVVSMAIEPVTIAERGKLLDALGRMVQEDPTLRLLPDKETGQVLVAGMGELHLEIVRERLEREFKLEASVGSPRVAYRQSVVRAAEAEGVFERSVGGHNLFARVRLRIEPSTAADRPEVTSNLSKEGVPLEFHPVILDAARDAAQSGGSLGFPLTQIRVSVLEAEYRSGHSTPSAYIAAVIAAFSRALEEAGVRILEPLMRFEIQVPEAYYGTVSLDLNRRRSTIQKVEVAEDIRIISGTVPLAEVFGYSNNLRSLSQGRASITLTPESYTPIPSHLRARFAQ